CARRVVVSATTAVSPTDDSW
nr:immunoglobulin heavy chain junction region [Macaca mulatta]MOW26687.1 immunoglobulin heavy chain junction region [Macaca mulatta]